MGDCPSRHPSVNRSDAPEPDKDRTRRQKCILHNPVTHSSSSKEKNFWNAKGIFQDQVDRFELKSQQQRVARRVFLTTVQPSPALGERKRLMPNASPSSP